MAKYRVENDVFPGRYHCNTDDRVIVKVTSVKKGLVTLIGVEGPLKGTLLSSQCFMEQYSKITDSVE